MLRWIVDRCEGRIDARETPIGYLPNAEDIDTRDLDIDDATMRQLTTINPATWAAEMESIGEYLDGFGDRLPSEAARTAAEHCGRTGSGRLAES